MPRGTHHDLTGLLLEGTPYPVLRVDDGGEWRLELVQRHRHLFGTRVRLSGTRDGFDLIAVDRISPA
ncbi:DUF5818 domain-containing protein [Sphingobium sp. CAP-1]|uniref:DUF5818 domain-containing protein n=1 Tax=Sphingobium sp. CAP-1 TaxID=2676077 RepID=UPI0012BB32B6|nr:DUF5818 domain-containing protein [Sphingobium sp. CAP-1]QGP77781.1 hypothetical protein GL174_01300 [Sphingobium sp. CAP-1]